MATSSSDMDSSGPDGLAAPSSTVGMAAAAVAVIAWGLSGVIAKNIDMGGLAIAGYRFSAYAIIVGVIGWFSGARISISLLRNTLWGGVALAADVALFFSAVKLTTIVNATMIGALQPVVVAIVAAKLFGERIKKRDIKYAAIAIVGVGVVVFGSTGAPEWNLAGDLAAVGALVAWSGYFVASRYAKDTVTSREYTIGTAFYTGLFNVPLAFAFGQSMSWPTWESFAWLLVLTFGAGILGHEMMNWSLRRIPLWLGSTMMLLTPVVSSAAAWIFLGEPLNALQLLAMLVVLAAVGAIVTGQAGALRKRRPLRR